MGEEYFLELVGVLLLAGDVGQHGHDAKELYDDADEFYRAEMERSEEADGGCVLEAEELGYDDIYAVDEEAVEREERDDDVLYGGFSLCFCAALLFKVARLFDEHHREDGEEQGYHHADVYQCLVAPDDGYEVGEHAECAGDGLHPCVAFGTLAAVCAVGYDGACGVEADVDGEVEREGYHYGEGKQSVSPAVGEYALQYAKVWQGEEHQAGEQSAEEYPRAAAATEEPDVVGEYADYGLGDDAGDGAGGPDDAYLVDVEAVFRGEYPAEC